MIFNLKYHLLEQVDMKDLESVKHILRMEIGRDRESNSPIHVINNLA